MGGVAILYDCKSIDIEKAICSKYLYNLNYVYIIDDCSFELGSTGCNKKNGHPKKWL